MSEPGTGGRWRATVLASSAILLAGCGTSQVDSAKSAAPPSGTSTSVTSPPAQSPSASTSKPSSAASTSSSPSETPASTPRATVPILADGRYAARVTAVNSRRRLVTVDVVQFFMGKAAATAAAEDHAPEVPPPNDYWIRNKSHLLRTLRVAPTAPITVNTMGATITGSATQDYRVTLTRLGQFRHLDSGIFWLTVRHGVVTRIAEQYRP